MFRWIRETFGHKPGGVHTRIATFRPKAPPPDPRAVDVEFTGREIAGPHPLWWELGDPEPPLYSFPEGTTERLMEESRALGVRMEQARNVAFAFMADGYDAARYNTDEARRTWGATYADLERQQSRRTGMMPELGADFERMAEEHDADRYDAASY